MSLVQLLLSIGILGFVLATNLGTRPVTRRRIVLPVVLVAVAASIFPTTTAGGNDHLLEGMGVLAGAGLGLVAGRFAPARKDELGRVVTAAGGAFVALWVAATAGRILFAEGATYLFAGAVTAFSQANHLSRAAWTATFVDLALTMVLCRVLVLAHQARRLPRVPDGLEVRPEVVAGRR